MIKKQYKYFVSFGYKKDGVVNSADCYCLYDEPIDTQEMIERLRRDIAVMKGIEDLRFINIKFFKRIRKDRH